MNLLRYYFNINSYKDKKINYHNINGSSIGYNFLASNLGFGHYAKYEVSPGCYKLGTNGAST